MASQLLPLGSLGLCDVLIILLICSIELIDKCVGSKIWVVMKGDKGEAGHSAIDFLSSNVLQSSVEHCLVSMTMSVCAS